MATEGPSPPLAPPAQTPYQLDLNQTTKAAKVLQTHIAATAQQARAAHAQKPDLLAAPPANDDDNDPDDPDLASIHIELILTTKKHITDKTRLKPHKIRIPHSITPAHATACLITADPQRLYKSALPADLQPRISRVIGLSKLKAKYKTFESRRQLLAEHDLFLADTRIITYLPQTLGKVFYRSPSKRPIPVEIGGAPAPATKASARAPGELRKSTKGTDGNGAAHPGQLSKEITRAFHAAIVHLSTSNTTAIRVATAQMPPADCAANVQSVVEAVARRILPKGWRNIRAMHLKGPRTPALPIWLAAELWEDDDDVLEEKKVHGAKRKAVVKEVEAEEGGGGGGAAMKRRKRRHNAAASDRQNKIKEQKADVVAAAGAVE